MATKSQIKRWIEAVEHKATLSVEKEFASREHDLVDILLKKSGIDDMLDQIQKLTDELRVLDYNLMNICTATGSISYKKHNTYSSYIPQDIRRAFINDRTTIKTPQIEKLNYEKIEKKELVNSNYRNVLAMVDSLSPKKAIEYLKELGFDTSSLEEPAKQELAVINVDKRYLFVCGDNK